MRRFSAGIACICALLIAACGGESQLPNPTGKGGVRAINAMPGSPFVDFRIEERSIGGVTYKNSTSPILYDDFEYIFNFDIDIAGTEDTRRIASVPLKVEVDNEHVFVLTGDIDNPTVTTWTTQLREWSDTDTVFEARFAHLSVTLGDIDVFFQDEADPIVAGGHVARLAYGDVMDLTDFEEGGYVITVTAAGDVNTVHFTSSAIPYFARTSHTAALFDGNENDTGPFVIGSMSTAGQSLRATDPAYLPTTRFIHSTETLPAVDVYRDELLTDLVASNVQFGTPTADLPVPSEDTTYYFTPTGSTATTLFSEALGFPTSGSPSEQFLIGDTDNWRSISISLDRASSSNIAKLSIYHGALNNQQFETFILDRDAELTDDLAPTIPRANFTLPTNTAVLAPGSYDIHLTAAGTRDPISTPFQIDVAAGDVVLLLAADDVDPAVVRLIDVSAP